MSNIILIGFMGSGKSTVGKLLARRLGMEFIDLDDVIEATCGMSINEIFRLHGEQYFRDIESSIIRTLLPSLKNSVVACGGGVVLRDENIEVIRDHGIVVYLRITAEEAHKRLMNFNNRPLLNVEDRLSTIKKLLSIREALYRKASHLIVEVDGKSPEEVVDEIVNLIGGTTR